MNKHILNDIFKFNSKHHSDYQTVCDICPLAKHHNLPFPQSESKATKPLELVSVDIWRPNQSAAHTGTKYFLTISINSLDALGYTC